MFGRQAPVTLFVVFVLVTIASLLLATLTIFDEISERSRLQSELASQLDMTADQLAASLALPVWNFDRPQVDKIADAAMKDHDIYELVITMHDESAPSGKNIVGRIRNSRWQSTPINTEYPANNLLVQDRNIVASGETVGSLRILATPKFMQEELTTHLIYVTSVSVILGAILTLGLYLLLWQNILKPLQQIQLYASEVSSGNRPSLAIPYARFRGELEKLRSAIEHMVDLLDSRYASLQQNENMLSSVLNAVPQCIFWKDRDSIYLGANEAFAKSAGLPNALAIVGKTDFDLPWIAQAATFRATDQEVLTEGATRDHYINQIEIAGGRRIWVEATKTPLRNQEGAIYAVLGIYADISDRKATDEALLRQTAFNDMANRILAGLVGNTGAALDEHLRQGLRNIAEFMGTQSAFIIQASDDFSTWSCTHEWQASGIPSYLHERQNIPFGSRSWSEQKLLNGEIIEVKDLRDLPPEAANIRQYWESKGFKSLLNIPLRGKGGKIRGCIGQVSTACNPAWTDEDIQRVKLLADAIANTLERSQAEDALRESEARFRILIEQSPMAISISRGDKWIYFNSAYVDIFRLESREKAMAKQNMLEHVAPECRPEIIERIRRRNSSLPVPNAYECTGLRPDGSRFPYYVEVAQVEFADGPASVAFITDLTERKRSEALLLESEKLRTVAGLASGVAHEINNPLAGMVQNAQVVLNRLTLDTSGNRDAAERHGTSFNAVRAYVTERDIPAMIETIRASGRQASRIVQNLLAYSRRDAPKVVAFLSDVVERTLELAASDYELKKTNNWSSVEIIRDFSPSAPAAPCYAAQIQQVLLNLIRNAVQAMRANDNGSPRTLTLRTFSRDNFACIAVQDTGPGIAPDIRTKLFEPFATTKPEGEGTGLGLFVSYHIINQNHGGHITVDSEPGKGACFTISLPRQKTKDPIDEDDDKTV